MSASVGFGKRRLYAERPGVPATDTPFSSIYHANYNNACSNIYSKDPLLSHRAARVPKHQQPISHQQGFTVQIYIVFSRIEVEKPKLKYQNCFFFFKFSPYL